MKKLLAIMFAAVMIVSMVACGNDEPAPETENESGSAAQEEVKPEGETSEVETDKEMVPMGGMAQIPNPYMDMESKTAAEEYVGFDIVCPETIEGSDGSLYRVKVDKTMIEVIYWNGEDKAMVLRKSTENGREGHEGDISGDYNTYENIVEENGMTLKGNGEVINLALWQDGEFTYSLYHEAGLAKEAFTELVSTIK